MYLRLGYLKDVINRTEMTVGTKRVIVDFDVGTDDAFALFALLYAEKIGQVKIEAIICTNGNASLDNVCKNVVRLLEIFNRTDIPVFKGAREPIIPPEGELRQYHGKDGFGDIGHDKHPDLSIIRKEPAAVAIRNLVVNNPQEITLVCLGPLTNIALAMKLYEDFIPNIKEIFLMGGNHAATGNVISTATAEFNFYVDPESAHAVLNGAQCPITIVTCETCEQTNITFDWRFKVLGLVPNPFIELMNKVESMLHSDKTPDMVWCPYDLFLIIAMLYPDFAIIKARQFNASVELHGTRTRGQVVIDHLKEKPPNVVIIQEINCEFAKEILLKAAIA